MNAVEYTNRKGDTYYLQAGKTPTGKPRYWFGRKLTGEPVQSVPAGYEIYEHPEQGLVSLRKTKPTAISQLDRDILSDGIRRCSGLEHFIVNVEGDSLVVYMADMSQDKLDRLMNLLAGPSSILSPGMQAARESMIQASNYTKMMRFTLVNPEERVFLLERWCFRGSIDDWIWVGRPAPLADLVRQYAPHLGTESFFELM